MNIRRVWIKFYCTLILSEGSGPVLMTPFHESQNGMRVGKRVVYF